MRVHLPYTRYPDGYGGFYESASYEVRLSSAKGVRTRSFPALIDSGAGRCLFHADFLKVLDLKLETGRPELTIGIGGEQIVWVHSITLHAAGGTFSIEAGFQEDLPTHGLLGMDGFFEHFIVTFDPLARECQLDRIYRA